MKQLFLFAAIFLFVFCYGQDSSKIAVIRVPKATPDVFTFVEQMPQFPGGEDSMMSFIQRNIHYPQTEREKQISGRVILSFIVNEDGSLTSITIKKSVSAGLDKEAVRVLRLMPKFIPGKQKGKAVKVNFILPVVFKLS